MLIPHSSLYEKRWRDCSLRSLRISKERKNNVAMWCIGFLSSLALLIFNDSSWEEDINRYETSACAQLHTAGSGFVHWNLISRAFLYTRGTGIVLFFANDTHWGARKCTANVIVLSSYPHWKIFTVVGQLFDRSIFTSMLRFSRNTLYPSRAFQYLPYIFSNSRSSFLQPWHEPANNSHGISLRVIR